MFDQRIISHSETSTLEKEISFSVATDFTVILPLNLCFWSKEVLGKKFHAWLGTTEHHYLEHKNSEYRLSFRKAAHFYFLNLFLDRMPVNSKDQCSCEFSECNNLLLLTVCCCLSFLIFGEEQSWLPSSRDNSLCGSQMLGPDSF